MKKALLTFVLMATFFAVNSQEHLEQLVKAERDRFSALRNYDLFSVSSNNFDVNFYRCEWTVNPAVRFIAGAVTSHFTITASTSQIVFDLANALIVDSVIHGGRKTGFTKTANNGLQVNFPSTLTAGQKDSVTIFYRGTPPDPGAFVISSHSGTPIIWTLSEPYGARTWWPCKDVLKDKADSIDIVLTYPAVYTSSSNGLPVNETTAGGNKTTYWKHRYPIVSYLVAFAITNYSVENDAVTLGSRNMPVSLYAYPENIQTFRTSTATAKFCLQGFSPLLSEYPFIKERYAQTQFGFGGGMEHQTNSFIGSPNAGLVAHELAHQWFGNKVTCGTWSDLWLNEGFASYMEFMYVELTNQANRFNFLQGWRGNITANPAGSVYVRDTLNVNRLFDGRLTYRKGGYVVHMLRWKLGDSSFFRGIRRYLNDPALAYKTAITPDLQRNLEAESGQQLTEFFNDWVYGEGHPNYNAAWSIQGNTVRVRLDQSTSHPSVPFFEMPVPLQFKSATRDTIIRVEHTTNRQIFHLNPGFTPDTLIIDPLLWILTGTKNTQKVPAIADPSTELLVYPNPARNSFIISLPNVTNAEIKIFDSKGRLVYSVKPTVNQIRLTASSWSSGVYWVHITGDHYREVRKLLLTAQ